MIHAKNPLYHRHHARHLSEKEWRRRREMHLFHVEYQTRRDCLRMLREVRDRRRAGNLEKLSDYVEDIMSSHIQLKTWRTLPWKWEFLNDVYNILALAHLDRCALPRNVDFLEPQNRYLLYLLRPERYRDMAMTFGGPNMYLEMAREERVHSRINQKLEQLEDRLRHSRFAIERAYLLFEIARCHFKEARYDKCLEISRKAFNVARSCNSLVWRFNSVFLVCQVHALLNRFERLKESLAKASQLAQDLRALHLVAFISICINVNNYDLAMRRMRQSEPQVRRSRNRSTGTTPALSSTSGLSLSGGSRLVM
ncbi:outer dynein arm-docking complex subunit 4 isoform X2 [Drosophila kikkawai]